MLPRVLIVEESLPYRRILREALMYFRECEVDDTPNAESAFEMALRREYALLLVAMPLQPFDGEVLNRLLAKAYPLAHPGKHSSPPVIYLLRPEEQGRGYQLVRDARVRGHLTIPPKIDTLLNLTATLLPIREEKPSQPPPAPIAIAETTDPVQTTAETVSNDSTVEPDIAPASDSTESPPEVESSAPEQPSTSFPSAHLGVKICGVTQQEQAEAIVAAGADALGINFWPESKRYLPLEQAKQWLPALKPKTHLIAVLVNPEPEYLEELIRSELVHQFQFHGDESPEMIAALQARGLDVIKALAVRDEESLARIGEYPCTTILLDSYTPGVYGGEGVSFPWELAKKAIERYPEKKIILAGGLTPDNIATAVQQVNPAAVDVASGVESAPGIKDLALTQKFIEAAHSSHTATASA